MTSSAKGRGRGAGGGGLGRRNERIRDEIIESCAEKRWRIAANDKVASASRTGGGGAYAGRRSGGSAGRERRGRRAVVVQRIVWGCGRS